MHFLLDNDVDVAVCRLLRQRGHDCTTAPEIGITEGADNDYTVLAAQRGWVLISHDNEFSATARKRTIGHHVHLRCEQPDAVDVLDPKLDDIVAICERLDNAWIQVSRDRLRMESGWS